MIASHLDCVREAMQMAGFSRTAVWWTETRLPCHENDEVDDSSHSSDGGDSEDDGVYQYERVDTNRRLDGRPSWNCYVVGCP